MSKDINDITKQIIKGQKEIYQVDTKVSKEVISISKDLESLSKDVSLLKKEMATVLSRLETLLEITTAISMYMEHEIDEEDIDASDDEFDSNEGWIPEINNWEENYTDDDEEEYDG